MSAHPNGQVESVTVSLDCECGRVARKTMTPEVAHRYADMVHASADGIPPIRLNVERENDADD
jgi:hypothetical protein